MEAQQGKGIDRRRALAAGGVALSGAALAGIALGRAPRAARAQAIGSGGGIAGGGLIEAPDAAVHFSLFATRLPLGTDGALLFSGRVELSDPLTGMRMVSTAIASYGPIEGDDENAREIRGTMAVERDGTTSEYPFVLRAFDGGGPGEGLDTLTLAVGLPAGTPEAGADDFAYELNGALTAGDIALVQITLTDE